MTSHIIAAAILVNAHQIQTGENLGKIVSVRGSVLSVVHDEIDSSYNWIILGTPEGSVYAASDERTWSFPELNKLTDAEIELTGRVGRFSNWRRFLGYQLTFDDDPESGFTVIQPPPVDPFSVPDMDSGSSLHRRKTRGRVVASTREHFFIRTDDKSILRAIPAEGCQLPKVGSVVTVSGFPKNGQSTPQLENSVWRIEQGTTGSLEVAEAVDQTTLYVEEGNRRYANNLLCGKIIKLMGVVESTPAQDAIVPGSFGLNCDGTSINVDISGLEDFAGKKPEVGTTMEVAGLCYANFSGADGDSVFPHLEGFSIIPRTIDDIRVIRAAPWWTPGRLVAVIGVLLAVIGLCTAWIVALRIISTRRARQLVREQVTSARAELKVEERTRLAVELHDSLSQTLTGVALQIDAAACADGEGAKSFLSTARNMLASCRQELNGCLWDLRCRTFEEKDMTEAVQRTLAPHLGSAKLTVRFNVPRGKLSEATAHAVLRIIRELATNSVKHGHAQNIKVAGEFHGDTISFSVLDDGRGFNVATAPGPSQGHFGLQGIRERLNEFNGTFRCESEPGHGAKFTVTLHVS